MNKGTPETPAEERNVRALRSPTFSIWTENSEEQILEEEIVVTTMTQTCGVGQNKLLYWMIHTMLIV